jgi:precorrin-2 dehydrogenase/sirohydrochlorin ferrochelatase
MTENPGLQITLDVRGRLCVVLGGDDEAADKVQRLLGAGAKVTVISPNLNEALRKLTASAKILHRARLFRSSDVQGAHLVINTLRSDTDQAKALYDLALKERFLLCSTDQPDFSTVMIPALVSRGRLRLAVSTSGTVPALSRRLRQDLEQVFDDQFAAFLDWLAKLRQEIQERDPDAERRHAQLRDAIAGFRFSGSIQYPPSWKPQPPQAAE